MAGMNTLHDVYRSKGDAFLKDLLNKYVIVNRNERGTFFGISKNNGVVSFHKKGGEITPVDRLLSKMYEAPISHFKKPEISASISENIPDGIFVGMKYRRVSDGIDLVITYIYNEDTGSYIHEKDILEKYAGYMGVSCQPVYFQGKLGDDHKTAVLDFVYTPKQDLMSRFKTRSFSSHVANVLGYEGDDECSEFVFRFYDGDASKSKAILVKLVDPVFLELSKEIDEPSRPSDYIYIILMDLVAYIQSYNNHDLRSACDGVTPDDNYISLMDMVYKDFINDHALKYMDIRMDVPDFISGDLDINQEAVRDQTSLSYIKTHDNFKEIYRILMNFFRKRRKPVSGIFDKDAAAVFNSVVDRIGDAVNNNKTYEGVIPSYDEYTGVNEEFRYIDTSDLRTSYKKMRGMTDVNVIVDFFQPVSMEHVNAAKAMYKRNGLPCVFVVFKNPLKTATRPLSQSTIRSMVDSVVASSAGEFAGTVYAPATDMESVINELYPRFQPVLWATTLGRAKDYLLQLDNAKRKNIKYNLKKGIEILEAPLTRGRDEILRSIKDNDFNTYRGYMPVSTHAHFFNLRSEIAG